MPTTDRAAVGHLLRMPDWIDLAIPRGGEGLIRRVVAEARMPVLKHYQGNCHVYVDADADLEMAVRIIVNAKAQRPGVCNAAETLLVHRAVAAVLPAPGRRCPGRRRGRAPRRRRPAAHLVPAHDARRAGRLGYRVPRQDPRRRASSTRSTTAIAHITRHGSGHTEAIVTRDLAAARRFVAEVDSSAVMVNASTRFNDGGQLGLGAEIGISTDKYHARGPCGLRELTSTKWVVYGDGQIRE